MTFSSAQTTAGTLTVIYPPVISIISGLTANIIPLNIGGSVSGLMITKTGIFLASATVDLANINLAGGLLTINTPTLTFNNINFTRGSGSTADIFTGTVTFTSTGGSIVLDSTHNLSITHDSDNTGDSPANLALTGTYNFATKALQLSLEEISATLAVVSLDASGVFLSYTPSATDDSATLLLGSTGVDVTVGSLSGGPALEITNGTLALEVYHAANNGGNFYALDANGNVALVGLSAGTLSLSGQLDVFINTLTTAANSAANGGANSITIQVGSAASNTVTLNNLTSAATSITGNLTLSIAGVISATGSFAITNSNGVITVLITNASLFMGSADRSMGLSLSGGNLGFQLNTDGSYAVDAIASTVALTGFSNFMLSGSVEVQVNTSTAAAQLSSLSSSLHNVNGNTKLSVAADSLTLSIYGFVTVTGSFGFTEAAPVTSGTVTTTEIDVYATGVSGFLGDETNDRGLKLPSGKLAFVLLNKNNSALTVQASATYALDASVTVSLDGFSDLQVAGTLDVLANTTGAAINRTFTTNTSSTVSLNFTDGTIVTDIAGTATLTVLNQLTLTGQFSFSEQTVASDSTLTKILVGATGVSGSWAAGDGTGLSLTGGSLALALYHDTSVSATSALYAIDASGSVSVTGIPSLSFAGSFNYRASTQVTAVNESIAVGATTLPLQFSGVTASELIGSNISLSVAGFAAASGNFTFVEDALGRGFDLSATNVSAAVGVGSGNSFTGVQLSGASVGLIVNSTGYAFTANGGNDSLVGISGLTASATGLSINVNKTGSALTNNPIVGSMTVGEVDVTGSVTLSVVNIGSLSGTFSFSKTSSSNGTLLEVAGSNIQVVAGANDFNVTATLNSVAVVVLVPASGSASFAVQAAGGTLVFNNLTQFTVSGSLTNIGIQYNNTGLTGQQLLGAPPATDTIGSVSFANMAATNSAQLVFTAGTVNYATGSTTTITSVTGGLEIGGLVTVAGNFAISETITKGVTKIYLGATNVTATAGPSGSIGIALTNGTLGLVVYDNTVTQTTSYAMEASGTLGLIGLSGITLTGTATALINTTGAAVSETIPTGPGGGSTQLTFTDGTNGSVNQTYLKLFSGSVNVGLGNLLNLSGSFTLTIPPPPSGDTYQALIGLTNVTISASDGGGQSASITNGTVGMIITGAASGTTFAVQATGTASVTASGGITANATATVYYNNGAATGAINIPVNSTGTNPLSVNIPLISAASHVKISFSGGTATIPGIGTISVTINSSTKTITISTTSLTLGSVFQISNLTATGTQDPSDSTGNTYDIRLNGATATLFPNQGFTASLTALTGNLVVVVSPNGSSGTIASYSITNLSASFSMAVGQAFTLKANTTFSYNPAAAAGSQLTMSFTNIVAKLPQFGVTGTVASLNITDTGITITGLNISSGSVSYGDIFTSTGVTLSGNLTVTFPTSSAAGSATGSLSLAINGLELFPGGIVSTSINQSGSVVGTFDFSGYAGSGGVSANGTLSIAISTGITLTFGNAFVLTTGSITINPGQNVMAQIASAQVTFPDFNSLGQVTLSNLQFLQTGISLGSATLQSSGSALPGIGSFLSFSSLTASLSNFVYSTATTYQETLVAVTSGTLPSSINLTHQVENGTSVTVQLVGSGGSVATPVTLTLSSNDFTVTNGQVVFTSAFTSSSSDAQQFFSANSGASTFKLAVSYTVSMTDPTFTGFKTTVSGAVSVNATGVQLFPNLPGFTATFGNVGGAYAFDTTANTANLTLNVTNATINLSNALTLSLGNITITPDSSSTIVSVPIATLSSSLFSGLASALVTNVQITKTGFSIGCATLIEGSLQANSTTYSSSASNSYSSVTLPLTPATAGSNPLVWVVDTTKAGVTTVESVSSVTGNTVNFTNPITLSNGDTLTVSYAVASQVPVSIGGLIQVSNASLVLSGFSVSLPQNSTRYSVAGSLALNGTVTLFPTTSGSPVTLGGQLQSTFTFGNGSSNDFIITVTNFDLTIGSLIQVMAGSVQIDPSQTIVASIQNATITILPLDNLTGTISELDITKTGFTISSAALTLGSNSSSPSAAYVYVGWSVDHDRSPRWT